ncbi:Hypothetical predicted protein [Olea europaea subsp. europaea]|uniref:ubiquitinyl hydrolase 1 n=1 Tax=Olea europaea subsp. europaea TaxID=158383 RepID=A0A8S0VMM8_OLEEU|nr:Hypothetical predicted protein [Olea europaea subsp. europaea]
MRKECTCFRLIRYPKVGKLTSSQFSYSKIAQLPCLGKDFLSYWLRIKRKYFCSLQLRRGTLDHKSFWFELGRLHKILSKNTTMYEPDPDVVRWGLHLIDVCSLTNCGSLGTVTCYEKDSSQIESVKEGYWDTAHSILESDKEIAHALQEELSRLAALEALGSEYAVEQHQKASILAQSWLDPSRRNFGSESQSNHEAYEMGTVSCNLGELSIECENQTVLPEIEDESALYGEMGRRLNRMVSIPWWQNKGVRNHKGGRHHHLPYVRRSGKTQSYVLHGLQLYDLVELKISGDGNCQFRSLSDQIYRTQEHHKFVREQVVNQLKSRRELYENYVPMAYVGYLQKIKKTGEWGDHVTLQAAADSYGVKIFVITSFKDTCYIEILPHTQKSNRIIFLSFWAEVHYNSIYPLGELPEVGLKKKKKWWHP